MCLYTCATIFMWKSEDNFMELVLSYRVDLGDHTLSFRLASSCFYPGAI